MKKYLFLVPILLAIFFVLPVITHATTTNPCLKEGEQKSLMPLPVGGQDERACCSGLVFKSTLPICPGCVAQTDVDTCVKNPGLGKIDPVTLDPAKYKLYLSITEIKKQIFLLKKQIMILLRLQKASTLTQPVACTMEAKICPDGVNYVGRTGPKCEFALCPSSTPTLVGLEPATCGSSGPGYEVKCHPGTTTEGMWINQDNPANWPTYKNEKYGFELRYPGYYKIVTDKTGWPNAVALFIQTTPPGAQSYRSAIEVWDNSTDFFSASNHPGQRPNFITKIGTKYLTINYQYVAGIDDQSVKVEWDKIISTFKLTK